MAQNFGLGRGLSSLIPQKKKPTEEKISAPQTDFNYFGAVSAKPIFKSSPSLSDEGKKAEVEKKVSSTDKIIEIEINKISANPFQPRSDFSEEKLLELAESIKTHGIIQPIIVSKKEDGFELIAGERRLQAAKIAGFSKIPAILKEADDKNKLELAVVENVQRQNLNPIEEAGSYKKMAQEFSLTQEEIAKKIGLSRSAVANKMRLIELPTEIQKALITGRITEGHAKLLLAIPNPEKQKAFFEMILKNNLTVRQTEEKTREVSVRKHKRKVSIDPEIKSIEDQLVQALGTKVKIKKSGIGGQIIIEYYSEEEFKNILDKIR